MDCFSPLQRICAEFESIRETALRVPENTDEIKQTMSFIEQARTKGIEELNRKIKVGPVTNFEKIYSTLLQNGNQFF